MVFILMIGNREGQPIAQRLLMLGGLSLDENGLFLVARDKPKRRICRLFDAIGSDTDFHVRSLWR